MMSSVTESSQLDDEMKNFMPQQIEQDYLSCLLGADETETEAQEIENEPAFDKNDEVVLCQPEDGKSDMADVLHEQLSAEPEGDEKINVDNANLNKQQSIEPYMSIETLSVGAPFVCQLMLIADVKFAVPLANFSRVIAVPENVKINNNSGSACLGKFEWQDKSMFLLALKRIMQPATTKQDAALNESDKIVLIENDGFGFVCNQMLETVTISAEDVLWRDESSQRYWLAGMVKEAGFAILDVKGILCSAAGKNS